MERYSIAETIAIDALGKSMDVPEITIFGLTFKKDNRGNIALSEESKLKCEDGAIEFKDYEHKEIYEQVNK